MLKPGDYADGRTFLGWRVVFKGMVGTSFGFYKSRAKAYASKPIFNGRYTRRITRVYRKDSPMRAALRELYNNCFAGLAGVSPIQLRIREILNNG